MLAAATVRIELAAPFAVSVTLTGFRDALEPAVKSGEAEMDRVIVPANPLTLQRPIDELFVNPAATSSSDWLELIPKSELAAETLTDRRAKWMRDPLEASRLPMYNPGDVFAGTEIVTVGSAGVFAVIPVGKISVDG